MPKPARRRVSALCTVQEIESAIEKLSVKERAKLVAKLCGWADGDWGRQRKTDAAAGKFATLSEDAGNA